MATHQESDATKVPDIVTGLSINTQYPVEKFSIKWRISNYSKIFSNIEAKFSTTSGSSAWKLKSHECVSGKRIELWRDYDAQSGIRIEYDAFIKTCHQILQTKGIYEFHNANDHCYILKIPEVEADLNDSNERHVVKFENDVFEFNCTLTVFGHSITRIVPSPYVQLFSSKKMNDDFEKLFQSKEHTDIIVSDGKNKISAHKVVLCARSPVFNAMFQQNMLENKNNEVKINDIDFDTLKELISFLYSGKIKELSEDSAMKMYYAADKYEITDLREICSEFLQMNLTIQNACSVIQLASQHKDDELEKGAVFFIQMHASSVKLTQGWEKLIRTHPKLIAKVFN